MKYGDRVKMTQLALREKLDGPKSKRCGVVVGESRDGKNIYVRRDGDKSRLRYHRSFWECDVSYPKCETGDSK